MRVNSYKEGSSANWNPRQKLQMAENPATHKKWFKKHKTKSKQKQNTPKLSTGDSPSLQKYANNVDINEAQACGSLPLWM